LAATVDERIGALRANVRRNVLVRAGSAAKVESRTRQPIPEEGVEVIALPLGGECSFTARVAWFT
jgi:hypothetical protein